jgi:hypothetical protein
MLREICNIEGREKLYHLSQIKRFCRNVGPNRIDGIIDGFVRGLVEGSVVKGEAVAINFTIIETWSRRDRCDNRWGDSNTDTKARTENSVRFTELVFI